jgi:ribulose-phosphate 3-epimerase
MPLRKQILPAIIALNQEELDQMLEKITFAENIMLDLMDGKFVGSTSLDFQIKLREGPNYQLHIMAVNPLERLEKIPPEIDTVILHVETLEDIDEAIKTVKMNGFNIFIALNPETNVTILEPYLEKIEGVLIMSVNPGQYGAKFLPEQLAKVRILREHCEKLNIEVDGGMNDSTIGLAIAAGANMIASGSFIMKSKDPKSAYNILSLFF